MRVIVCPFALQTGQKTFSSENFKDIMAEQAEDGHIDRMLYSLTDGSFKGKWTKEKLGTDMDLHDIFSLFVMEQEVHFLLLSMHVFLCKNINVDLPFFF